MAGAKYGFLLGSLMFVLGEWAPQPAGAIVLWSLISAHLAIGNWILWQRLRLGWFSAGGIAALFAVVNILYLSTQGLTIRAMATGELPLADAVAFWAALVFVPLAIGVESLRNAPAWRAMSAGMERVALWEMIVFRHVPQRATSNAALDGQVA